MSTTQSIQLNDIQTLVPTRLVHGDRELDGAPMIECRVNLRISDDQQAILADVYFKIEETKGNRTTAEQTWTKEVFRIIGDQKIESIQSPTESYVKFRGKAGGFQIVFPGEDLGTFLQAVTEAGAAVYAAWTKDVEHAAKAVEIAQGLAGIKVGGNYVE